MKQIISESDFRDAFERMGRHNNFSYAGLGALFDYLEQCEQDCDTELELDVIALCCEFVEFEDMEEFWKSYSKEDFPTKEDIMNATTVIDVGTDGFLLVGF